MMLRYIYNERINRIVCVYIYIFLSKLRFASWKRHSYLYILISNGTMCAGRARESHQSVHSVGNVVVGNVVVADVVLESSAGAADSSGPADGNLRVHVQYLINIITR